MERHVPHGHGAHRPRLGGGDGVPLRGPGRGAARGRRLGPARGTEPARGWDRSLGGQLRPHGLPAPRSVRAAHHGRHDARARRRQTGEPAPSGLRRQQPRGPGQVRRGRGGAARLRLAPTRGDQDAVRAEQARSADHRVARGASGAGRRKAGATDGPMEPGASAHRRGGGGAGTVRVPAGVCGRRAGRPAAGLGARDRPGRHDLVPRLRPDRRGGGTRARHDRRHLGPHDRASSGGVGLSGVPGPDPGRERQQRRAPRPGHPSAARRPASRHRMPQPRAARRETVQALLPGKGRGAVASGVPPVGDRR